MSHWLARAEREGTPLIEGERAIFIWKGRKPPRLIGDFNGWGWGESDGRPGIPFEPVEHGTWAAALELPLDAYMEYAFEFDGERTLDRYNPHSTPDGLGHRNNFFYMPEGGPTPLLQKHDAVPQGKTTTHLVETRGLAASRTRRVHLYEPVYRDEVPLVFVLDGNDYLRRARLPTLIDNLVAEGRIQPVALAMVENSRHARMLEYMCSEGTVGFLTEVVLPFARERLNLMDEKTFPGAHGIMGASMGGLQALYTGLRVPEIAGNVLSQSGAFEIADHKMAVIEWMENRETLPIKVWQDVGRFEWLLETNRRMRQRLQAHGYASAYAEYATGHNYPAWRDNLWRGLEFLYGLDQPAGF